MAAFDTDAFDTDAFSTDAFSFDDADEPGGPICAERVTVTVRIGSGAPTIAPRINHSGITVTTCPSSDN